jgi:glycosyltransferase involved in cell wall biosynthesis
MARVAIVETYPYEAVCGGDAVYLDAIRVFLTDQGHLVDTYVTDVTRGRSNPALTLRTNARGNHRWRLRNAISLGEDRFWSADPRMVAKAFRRIPGRGAPKDDRIGLAEADWLAEQLADRPPDLAILAFGACAFAERISGTRTKVLALKGFFSDRRIRLGEDLPTPDVDAALLGSLAQAAAAGFNNHHDLDLYGELSGRTNGLHVGVGLPRRIQPAADSRPTLLFVAARTKPNIESLEWFLTQVWPAVRSAAPQTELRVVGSVCTAFAGCRTPGVSMLGFVDRIDDEYRNCWAVIAPLVSGSSGVKIKIAEALSFGRPVVTTSIGVDPGRPLEYGDAVRVADDPAQFAAQLIGIVSDERQLDGLHDAAAGQFERHFSPEAAYCNLSALLEPTTALCSVAAR